MAYRNLQVLPAAMANDGEGLRAALGRRGLGLWGKMERASGGSYRRLGGVALLSVTCELKELQWAHKGDEVGGVVCARGRRRPTLTSGTRWTKRARKKRIKGRARCSGLLLGWSVLSCWPRLKGCGLSTFFF